MAMSELMSVGPRNGIAAVSNKVAHVDVNVEEGHNSLPVDNGKSGSGNASKKKESHKSQKKDRLDSFISLAMLLKVSLGPPPSPESLGEHTSGRENSWSSHGRGRVPILVYIVVGSIFRCPEHFRPALDDRRPR